MSDNGDTVDEQAISNLRHVIARSRGLQEVYLDTIADTALVAVNQVQDKRLDFLESGPEFDASLLFIDFILGVALTPALGRVLNKAGHEIFSRLIRPRIGITDWEKSSQVIQLVEELSVDNLQLARTSNIRVNINVVHAFKKSSSNDNGYRLFREFATDIGNSSAGEMVNLVRQRLNTKSEPANPDSNLGENSAGASILDAVSQFVTDQRQAIRMTHDFYDIKVANRNISPNEWQEVMSLMYKTMMDENGNIGPPKDISQFRNRLIKVFEAAIWAAMFPPKTFLSQRRIKQEKQIKEGTWGDKPGTVLAPVLAPRFRSLRDNRLIEYWTKRFWEFYPSNLDITDEQGKLEAISKFFGSVDYNNELNEYLRMVRIPKVSE